LPNAGGLNDQPAGLVTRMAVAENVYDSIKAWRKAPDWSKWSTANPDAWRIVQMVAEMRIEADKYAE
jgi:hypothetical protein